MVNFDQQNEDDLACAINNARDVKLPFNKDDIKLCFSLIESKMQFAGLKKQWSKRQICPKVNPLSRGVTAPMRSLAFGDDPSLKLSVIPSPT